MTTTPYHLSKKSRFPFDETVNKLKDVLKEEGFGIITSIDLKETFHNKLNLQFRKYLILRDCNPQLAYDALLEEDKIGVFLPCNVVIQEHDDGDVEVSIVDPAEMMRPIKNSHL